MYEKWLYGLVSLIEVGEDPYVSVCAVRLSRIGVVIVEIWGEVFPPSVIWGISEFGGEKRGNKFVRS